MLLSADWLSQKKRKCSSHCICKAFLQTKTVIPLHKNDFTCDFAPHGAVFQIIKHLKLRSLICVVDGCSTFITAKNPRVSGPEEFTTDWQPAKKASSTLEVRASAWREAKHFPNLSTRGAVKYNLSWEKKVNDGNQVPFSTLLWCQQWSIHTAQTRSLQCFASSH